MFPLVNGMNEEWLRNFHPLKQRQIYGIYNYGLHVKDICFIVFGSAITEYCNSFSDLDIAVVAKNEQTFAQCRRYIDSICNGECDVIYFNLLDRSNRIREEIIENGLVLLDTREVLQE